MRPSLIVADTRIDELRRRLERDPGSRLFAQLAEELRKAGELAEAIRVARQGLADHPGYPSARLTLGRALLDSRDATGPARSSRRALRDAPDNILASRFLGQAREALGDLGGPWTVPEDAADGARRPPAAGPDRALETRLHDAAGTAGADEAPGRACGPAAATCRLRGLGCDRRRPKRRP